MAEKEVENGEFPLEKRIALVFDFDLTLTEQYMQIPMIAKHLDKIREAYGGKVKVDGKPVMFNNPIDYFKLSDDWSTPHNGVSYLSQILFDINEGILPKFTKDDLRGFGKEVQLAPGIPEFFRALRKKWEGECKLYFYIISVGIKEIIEGSAVAKYMDGIFASEFASIAHHFDKRRTPVIDGIKDIVIPFSKTQKLIQIVKGDKSHVDMLLSSGEYAFDYRNVQIDGDGISDVSVSAYGQNKGSSVVGVQKAGDNEAAERVASNPIIRKRIDILLPRDYRQGGKIWTNTNRAIHHMLNRTCTFDQPTLNRYRKGRLEGPDNQGLREAVEAHIEKCDECEGTYNFKWVPF